MHKDTKGKPPISLVPPYAIEEIARIRAFGNEKYGSPWGWLDNVSSGEFIDAALRHLLKWNRGETTDPESGLSHLAHAATSVVMALEIETRQSLLPSVAASQTAVPKLLSEPHNNDSQSSLPLDDITADPGSQGVS